MGIRLLHLRLVLIHHVMLILVDVLLGLLVEVLRILILNQSLRSLKVTVLKNLLLHVGGGLWISIGLDLLDNGVLVAVAGSGNPSQVVV